MGGCAPAPGDPSSDDLLACRVPLLCPIPGSREEGRQGPRGGHGPHVQVQAHSVRLFYLQPVLVRGAPSIRKTRSKFGCDVMKRMSNTLRLRLGSLARLPTIGGDETTTPLVFRCFHLGGPH